MTVTAAVLEELKAAVGSQCVSNAEEKLMVYSFDSTFQEHKPEVVVKPHTAREVAAVVKIAAAHHVRRSGGAAGRYFAGNDCFSAYCGIECR